MIGNTSTTLGTTHEATKRSESLFGETYPASQQKDFPKEEPSQEQGEAVMSDTRWWRRRQETAVSELQKRSNPVRTGIIFLVVLIVAVYFGFTKHVPFKHGYRLNAVFSSSVNVRPKSPVRIAGVTVGTVTSTRLESSHAALVTMEIEGKGLPIHSDATLKIRPKIFLEGNWFVELQPGSPSAPELSSGATIPVTQTSEPVQLDQLLDALNTDTRANLQTFLVEYGAALTAKPTPAENAEQSPEVSGLNMAQALNKAYRLGPEALRDGTIVNQAFAGTETHDLSQLFSSIEKVSAELDVHEQALGELVGHFNTFLHIFAAQGPSLRTAVAELPSALHGTEHAFAELRERRAVDQDLRARPDPRRGTDPRHGRRRLPLDRTAPGHAEAERARRRRRGAAHRGARDRLRHRRAGRLPAAAHQLQQVPEQGALPRRLHQAPGWRQHLRGHRRK